MRSDINSQHWELLRTWVLQEETAMSKMAGLATVQQSRYEARRDACADVLRWMGKIEREMVPVATQGVNADDG